jgi:hypothetical protein
MLTLRPLKLGPPAYAHLADYEIIIGRIMEQREPMPDREWFWALQITGAHRAGVATSGYAANLEEAKAAFRASLEATGPG